MIWAILAVLGVPLWVLAVAIFTVVFRDRRLRKRPGNFRARVQPDGKKRWTKGHAIWVSDVFAWRGSPAAWKELLSQVSNARLREPDDQERKKLHRMGDELVIAEFALDDGESLKVAAQTADTELLHGPVRPYLGP